LERTGEEDERMVTTEDTTGDREADRVEQLLPLLAVGHYNARQGHSAVEELIKIGAPAVQPLVAEVLRSIGRSTLNGLHVLRNIRDPLAVQPMAEALHELRSAYEIDVLRELNRLVGSGAAAEDAAKAARENPLCAQLAIAIMLSLEEIGDRRAVPAIAQWDPLAGWGTKQRLDLLEDRKLGFLNREDNPGPWPAADALTRRWVDALIGLGGDEAQVALRGASQLP